MQIQDLVNLFQEGNQEKIDAEINKIASNNPSSAIGLLEAVFSAVREPNKVQVCRTFELISTNESYDALKKMLKNRSWHVRHAVAHSMANMKGDKAIPDLEALLNDKAYGVREDVRILIEKMQ